MENQKKSCKSCSTRPLGLKTPMLIFAIYFIFSAVYGTYSIFSDILSLFK